MKYIYFFMIFLFTSSAIGQDLKRENQKSLNAKETSVEKTEKHNANAENSKIKSKEMQKGQNVSKDSTKLPEGFPKYVDTGNPEKDQEDYKRRKKEWIKNNPEEYKKMTARQNSSVPNERTAPVIKKSK